MLDHRRGRLDQAVARGFALIFQRAVDLVRTVLSSDEAASWGDNLQINTARLRQAQYKVHGPVATTRWWAYMYRTANFLVDCEPLRRHLRDRPTVPISAFQSAEDVRAGSHGALQVVADREHAVPTIFQCPPLHHSPSCVMAGQSAEERQCSVAALLCGHGRGHHLAYQFSSLRHRRAYVPNAAVRHRGCPVNKQAPQRPCVSGQAAAAVVKNVPIDREAARPDRRTRLRLQVAGAQDVGGREIRIRPPRTVTTACSSSVSR